MKAQRKLLTKEQMSRDITWAKFSQGKEGHVEIDNSEKDSVLIWGFPKKLGREGEEAQVVIIHREKVPHLISLLERCIDADKKGDIRLSK